jgi:hypothetical protein
VGAAVLPVRAPECQDAVARYLSWGYTAALPYDSTERARLADCTRLAADRAPDARSSIAQTTERRTPDEVMLGDSPATSRASARPPSGCRDTRPRPGHGPAPRVVVCGPTQDAKIVSDSDDARGRASGTDPVLPLGVPPLGARLAERWGDRLAVIGFTALRGQWSRSGQPSQPLAPLPPHALEARALAAGAAGDAAGWAYLDRAALRSLGSVPSRLFGKVTTTDWSTSFDGVLVIRDEAAPTFERRR